MMENLFIASWVFIGMILGFWCLDIFEKFGSSLAPVYIIIWVVIWPIILAVVLVSLFALAKLLRIDLNLKALGK